MRAFFSSTLSLSYPPSEPSALTVAVTIEVIMASQPRLRNIVYGIGALIAGVLCVSAIIWRDDILKSWLDPKQPFQTYHPPPTPDYDRPDAWALLPHRPDLWTSADPPADVFFVHPTTFNGGANWNGPLKDRASERLLNEVMTPNYAGPFQKLARVFAPRYRQASLYAFMANREDAQDAREFAYRDIRGAFEVFLRRFNSRRPVVLVGVDQGGQLVARLLEDVVARDPALRRRLVAAYVVDAIVPADRYGPHAVVPACSSPVQTGCILAWEPAHDAAQASLLAKRALVWTSNGLLEDLGHRAPLCVNPLLGAASDAFAPERLNRGATNASSLEWGARPAFLPRQSSAQCIGGFLRISQPQSPSLRRSGGWIDRFKAPPFNVFYADEEADAKGRIAALINAPGYQAPTAPLGDTIMVIHSEVHRPN